MNTPQESQKIAHETAKEMVEESRSIPGSIDQKIDRTLAILALTKFSMTERELREYLTLAGINLTKWENFERARDQVAWYVSTNTLEISELFTFTLVSTNSEIVERFRDDELKIARMDQMKMDGIFFRDMMCPVAEL